MGRISVNGERRTVSARTKTEARYNLDRLRRAARRRGEVLGDAAPAATASVLKRADR